MHARTARSSVSSFAAAFVLTVSLFALWGLGHRLYDALVMQFTGVIGLRGFELALTRSMYSIVYFLGAIPAALYACRFGYKAAIVFGLGSICIGAFLLYPAAETQAFAYFLLAAAVMSCGWIFLEVAANPLAAALGSVETSVRRLNVAQSFFPLGALAGVFAGRWMVAAHLALPAAGFAYSIVHPYIVIGAAVLLLAFRFEEVRFPPVASEHSRDLKSTARDFRALLSRPLFVFGIAAQSCSVLALAGTWSVGGSYFAAAFPGAAPLGGVDIFVWSLAVFALGRFVGSALMFRFDPDRLLAVFAGGGLMLAAIAACTGGPLGAVSVIASSFFLSITWPTVLGIAIRGFGPLMKLGTALVCMGGALGGVAYQMLNVIWTNPSVRAAMVVPAVSYAVVLAFAVAHDMIRRTAAAPPAAAPGAKAS